MVALGTTAPDLLFKSNAIQNDWLSYKDTKGELGIWLFSCVPFVRELDGKPFNRRERSIVYQRAKNQKQTVSFGMQDDPNRIGYEWASHSVYPKHVTDTDFRVLIGNDQCSQPIAQLSITSCHEFRCIEQKAIHSQ
ncbi:hypothetical protein FQR65_LT18881 [Abscondita terminalis]|nr:hypothetical protein FQR65_LT18881 [Abscondita terminalis]